MNKAKGEIWNDAKSRTGRRRLGIQHSDRNVLRVLLDLCHPCTRDQLRPLARHFVRQRPRQRHRAAREAHATLRLPRRAHDTVTSVVHVVEPLARLRERLHAEVRRQLREVGVVPGPAPCTADIEGRVGGVPRAAADSIAGLQDWRE